MIDVDTGSFLLMVLAAMLSTLIFPFIGLALRLGIRRAPGLGSAAVDDFMRHPAPRSRRPP